MSEATDTALTEEANVSKQLNDPDEEYKRSRQRSRWSSDEAEPLLESNAPAAAVASAATEPVVKSEPDSIKAEPIVKSEPDAAQSEPDVKTKSAILPEPIVKTEPVAVKSESGEGLEIFSA